MNNLTANQSKENLLFHLHNALIKIIMPINEFIFIDNADVLMNEFQEVTTENYTKENLLFLVKKYKKLMLASKLQVQSNEILANL
tara:strand:- start:155 stop:409 length:255 start_codon:yes stop_codon:yes gene_type:complete